MIVRPKHFHGIRMMSLIKDVVTCQFALLLLPILTFASCLHLGHLPLLLLVQPLQLGRLEDPRVHLEHAHSRLGLRAQHRQHSAGAWCSLTTGVERGACAVEAGSLGAGAAI